MEKGNDYQIRRSSWNVEVRIMDFVLYETDESFDYPTGYGYATQYEIGYHGFNIEVNWDNGQIISVEGYGECADASDITTLEELKKYISTERENNKFPFRAILCDEELDELVKSIEEVAA